MGYFLYRGATSKQAANNLRPDECEPNCLSMYNQYQQDGLQSNIIGGIVGGFGIGAFVMGASYAETKASEQENQNN